MGSSSSRLVSRPHRPQRPNSATRRATMLSSIFLCGGSTSHARLEMEDDSSELLVNSAEHGDLLVGKFKSATKDSVLVAGTGSGCTSPKVRTGAASESSMLASDDSFGDGSGDVETRNQDECLPESKETITSHQYTDGRNSDIASASYVNQPSSDPSNTPSDGLGDSSSDGLSVENHHGEVVAVHDSDAGSVVSNTTGDHTMEVIPPSLAFLVSEREQGRRDGSVLHVDVASISSNTLSRSTAEISNRDARRSSRRQFWDAFSRRSSRRHSDSQTLFFSSGDSNDSVSHDRWLLDFSDDFFDDGIGGDSGHFASRAHSINERHLHSRSEMWERLRRGFDGSDRHTVCPSGLHPDGTCTCDSISMAQESGTRASVSRIVMLAEALFEVLDEIHRQPMSLSLSIVSLPAPESVVNSFPVKSHKKLDATESRDDVAQCYICLAEYEEGDNIRVLPCHHEYHMSCVDKWLKEIHGVCPLCRGDVCTGSTECSVSNSETSSIS